MEQISRKGIEIKNQFKKMKTVSPAIMGISIAAGWGWGFSMLTGMTVVQERGVIPFAIWGLANALALLFFGWFLSRYPKILNVSSNKYVTAFTTLVRIFSIWIQMSAIFETMNKLGIDPNISKIFAYGSGILFVVSAFTKGLPFEIKIDGLQGGIILTCVLVNIGIGLTTSNISETTMLLKSTKEIPWALWSGLLLLGGPFVDLSNIQRAREVHQHKHLKSSYTIAFIYFTVYMASILIMSIFKFNNLMNITLLIAVIMLAHSTLNSDAVALHEIGGRKFGLALGLVTIIAWEFVKVVGFFNLWQIIANIRIYVAIAVIVWTIIKTKKYKKNA